MFELIVLSMGFGFFTCLLALFYAFCSWKLFSKARVAPWKSLIPIYNLYCLIRICKLKWWLIFVYIGYLLIPASSFLGGIVNFVMILFHILLYYSLGKAFRKSTLFTIGLIVLPLCFFPLLSLDSSRYRY